MTTRTMTFAALGDLGTAYQNASMRKQQAQGFGQMRQGQGPMDIRPDAQRLGMEAPGMGGSMSLMDLGGMPEGDAWGGGFMNGQVNMGGATGEPMSLADMARMDRPGGARWGWGWGGA